MRAYAVTEMAVAQTKPSFESRLAVFRVRANFVAPYRKCRFFYLEPKHTKTKSNFIKQIEHIGGNWPNGTYFVKMSSGQVFARFDVYEGKVRVLYKESPMTGKLYPIWAFFKK
jgi:hypothetical protein